MKITVKPFGKKASLYTLENDHGYRLEVTDFGARIVNFFVPTKTSERNIVLGFDSAEEYLEKDPYIGATIGRVAGRITKGQFTLEGKSYQALTQADHGNTLHGGPASFEVKYWQATTQESADEVQVIFHYLSPDGENGFPGNLGVEVTYTLTNQNEWRIDYQATTDQATLFNPTNHVYFNLTGDVTQATDEHQLTVAADRFVVVGEDTTATGEMRDVTGTPFDLRKGKVLSEVYQGDYQQTVLVNGFDHPFVLTADTTPQATIVAPDQQLKVEMTTTEPAVVIFTAQFGEDAPIMRGEQMAHHGGITLETQVMPGAVEYEGFGNIEVAPNEGYTSSTTYKIISQA